LLWMEVMPVTELVPATQCDSSIQFLRQHNVNTPANVIINLLLASFVGWCKWTLHGYMPRHVIAIVSDNLSTLPSARTSSKIYQYDSKMSHIFSQNFPCSTVVTETQYYHYTASSWDQIFHGAMTLYPLQLSANSCDALILIPYNFRRRQRHWPTS
jgi:hypothetical protein